MLRLYQVGGDEYNERQPNGSMPIMELHIDGRNLSMTYCIEYDLSMEKYGCLGH